MKVIGLTGGIGSGKTTVSRMFSELGAPVYIADEQARRLAELPGTQAEIRTQFGDGMLDAEGKIDRRKLANIVFSDPEKLERLNAIIHPKVAADFREWAERQSFPFVIREAAILFESGSHRDCDKVITVTAPLEVRIARVIARDGTTRDEVLRRMANQWPEDEKIRRSDYVIHNVDLAETIRQIRKIFTELRHL